MPSPKTKRPASIDQVLFGCIRGALVDTMKSHPSYVGQSVKIDRLARSAAKRAKGNLYGALRHHGSAALLAALADGPRGSRSESDAGDPEHGSPTGGALATTSGPPVADVTP